MNLLLVNLVLRNLILALLLGSQATPQRVAVLDFVAIDLSDTVAQAATQLTASKLTEAGLEAVSSKDVAALVSLEERKQVLGASDMRATERIALLLNARYVVAGSLAKLGARLLITVQMLDHRTGAVVNRVSVDAPSVDAVAATIAEIVPQLLAESGRLQLYDQVPGARVFIDEALIGTMPLSLVAVAKAGEHTLRVESAEHAPWQTRFTATRGKTTRIRVELDSLRELEDRSRTRRITALALLGGVVATGVTSGLLFMSTFREKARYDALDPLLATQAELDAQAGRTLGLYAGAWAAGGVAAALLATSVYLLVDDPHRRRLHEAETELRLEPVIAPNAVGLVLSGALF